MQLHYQRLGHGRPLILIHGLFGSADNWGAIAKYFAQYYQVISVDLRNHGRSPHHASQNYVDMTADLIELCDSLNLDKIDLLGHSLGGKVAMQFALQFPNRIDKLIVVDMAMRAYPDTHTYLIDAMLSVDISSMQTRRAADQALSSSVEDTMVRQFLLMNLVKSGERLTWRLNLTALKDNYPALQQAVYAPAKYDKPSLFIRGQWSDYVSDDDIEQIKFHFTKAEFASLPTDHWVHAEQPQAFNKIVGQFLIN